MEQPKTIIESFNTQDVKEDNLRKGNSTKLHEGDLELQRMIQLPNIK